MLTGYPQAQSLFFRGSAVVIPVGVSMDSLRQLGFLAAVRAQGSPSRTGTVRPVDPVGLDALCLELCVACIAIEDTHGSSLRTVLRNASGRSGVGAGAPAFNPPSSTMSTHCQMSPSSAWR